MKKLATTIAAAALLTGTAAVIQPQPIALAEETNAEEVAVKPTITNITVDKPNYTTEDGNATVRVTLDNIDAVRNNKIYVKFATDNPLAGGYKSTSNEESNNYIKDGNDLVVNLPLTDGLSDGEYHLNEVKLNDEYIVKGWTTEDNKIPTIQPTFTYENTKADELAPEFVEATLDKTQYEVGDTINLTVKFKDENELDYGSGRITRVENDGSTYHEDTFSKITSQQLLDENSGLRQAIISTTATKSLQNKLLKITNIYLKDIKYNFIDYGKSLPELQFTVVPKGTLAPKAEENKDEQVAPKAEENKGDQEAPKKEENKDEQVAPKAEENKGDQETPKKEENKDEQVAPKAEENKGDQETPKKEENKDEQVAPKAEENKGDKETPKKEDTKAPAAPKNEVAQGGKTEANHHANQSAQQQANKSVEHNKAAEPKGATVKHVAEKQATKVVHNKAAQSSQEKAKETAQVKQTKDKEKHSILPKTGLTTTIWTTVAGVTTLIAAGIIALRRKNK